MVRRLAAAFALALLPSLALAQAVPLQAGPVASGHVPMYSSAGSAFGQPIIQDSGPAAGGAAGLGLTEQLFQARGAGSPPYANAGSGPLGTNWCNYDGPTTGPFHYLCMSPNAQGGGLLTYGSGGGAPTLPLNFSINGTLFNPQQLNGLPLIGGTMTGPISGGSLEGTKSIGFNTPVGPVISNVPMTYGRFGQAVGWGLTVNSTQAPQVLGGVTDPSSLSGYSDRDSVAAYVDNVAPALLTTAAGTFTATTFSPTTALNGGIVAALKVGMLIDTSDASKFTGTIAGWAADGTSVTVSGWFQQGNTAAGQVPAGPNAYFNPITKIWAHNANIYLTPNSWATAGSGFELGVFNNKGYNASTDTPYTWGFDAVNLGTYTGSKAHLARRDWNIGYEATQGAGRIAAFHVAADAGAGFGFLSEKTGGMSFATRPNATANAAWSIDANGNELVQTVAIIGGHAGISGIGPAYFDLSENGATGTSGYNMRLINGSDGVLQIFGHVTADNSNQILATFQNAGPNGLVFNGAASGATPYISSAGDTNAPLGIYAGGTSGVVMTDFRLARDPTAADFGPGQCTTWNNTSAGTTKFVCNVGGTLRSTALN